MKMSRWLMVAALGVMSCTWLQADSAHYEINLEGFDADQEFTFTPNPELPPPSELANCLPVGSICLDASVRINSGGGSQDENGVFTFNSDQVDANGNIFFANTGPLISSVLIQFDQSADETTLTCDGGDIFQNCGFLAPDGPVDVYFYNAYTPGGGIPSLVPEPSQWMILALAFAAMIVVRSRKTIANAFFAQTQRLACPTRDS